MTGRLPFDPSRMRAAQASAEAVEGAVASPGATGGQQGGVPAPARSGPAGAPGPGSEAPLISISALADLIAGALERVDRPLRVVGEVSGFRERTHWYFDLKDAGAVVNCVMFASSVRRAGLALENGRAVVATGRVEFYAKGGKVSFLCEKLEPVGEGVLELAFRRLVAEIRALGWFEPARKRALPTFPRRVAVVTSRTGAALQDVLDTARRRCPAVDIAIVDVRVQGERAAAEVAAAINWLGANHARLGLDAVLLTRGGGSAEDLWAFNEKIVAAAIVGCPLPVVAAIGHETDTTIAELVADERCATPTQAAMRLFPDRGALGEQIDALGSRVRVGVEHAIADARRRSDDDARRLVSAVRLRLAEASARMERVAGRLEQQRPAAAQARRGARLAEAERRLTAAMRSRARTVDVAAVEKRLREAAARGLRQRREAAASLGRTLAAVSPLRVLGRGYSVTTRADGRLIRAPGDVSPGEQIRTRVADGLVRSIVEGEQLRRTQGATPAENVEPCARPRTKPRPSRDARAQDQPGLFG